MTVKSRNAQESNSGREPLAIRAAAVAAIASLVNLAVLFGAPWSVEQRAGLLFTVNLFSILAVVVWTRGTVTPVDDPRDVNGHPLVTAYEGNADDVSKAR